jgi:hypothetical protein
MDVTVFADDDDDVKDINRPGSPGGCSISFTLSLFTIGIVLMMFRRKRE